MSKFPSEVIFSKKLSASDQNDEKSMFANIIRTQWKANDGKIIYFVRFELKLNRGLEAKPMCISITPVQLDWIVNCINKNVNHMLIEGEREGKYISFEKIESLFLSEFAISTLEKKTKFGVLLDSIEKENLVLNHGIFSFIMKFQQTTGLRLKELIRWLYCSFVYRVLRNEIKENCNGCKNNFECKSEHSCKLESQGLIDQFIDQTIDKKEMIEKYFYDYFEYFSEILCIDEENIAEAKHLVEYISKAENIDYSNVLNILFKDPIDDPIAKSIIKLIEERDEANENSDNLPSTSGSSNKRIRFN